jgi:uncharacterized repeat protein (TIGR01451 family)
MINFIDKLKTLGTECGGVLKNIARLSLFFFVTLSVLFAASEVHAAGTPAGTEINNTATFDYTAGIGAGSGSASATFYVAELMELSLNWVDGANVTVAPSETAVALRFVLTNAGNGSDTYSLSIDSLVAGDDFDPIPVAGSSIYFDDGGTADVFDGGDTLYVVGANDPTLAADDSITLFVVNDMLLAVTDGELGSSMLTATSLTGTGVGTIIPAGGEGGTPAEVGLSGGIDSDTGTYVVSNVVVSILKSAVVLDPWGGTDPVTGASITYTIIISASGGGTAEAVVITDPMPAGTTFTIGTLTLDNGGGGGAVVLTDNILADDEGDVGLSTPGTVTVTLGDITNATPVQTVIFTVTID